MNFTDTKAVYDLADFILRTESTDLVRVLGILWDRDEVVGAEVCEKIAVGEAHLKRIRALLDRIREWRLVAARAVPPAYPGARARGDWVYSLTDAGRSVYVALTEARDRRRGILAA